jgi:glycosyltransferase involved in cell wall biosynthesis
LIYIGIPARDERHTIGPLLWRVRELLLGSGRDFHVLVIDDGSCDGTHEALESYQRVLPLTAFRNDEPAGYGACLERLAREAVQRSDYPRRDALVTLQADFSDPPEAVPEMVRRFEGGADLVVATSTNHTEETRREKITRVGARFVGRRLPVPSGIVEPLGSLRLYRLFILDRALSETKPAHAPVLRHDGWAANAELLIHVWPHVRRAEQVEVVRDLRRYRATRVQPFHELRQLGRAARDPVLRELGVAGVAARA